MDWSEITSDEWARILVYGALAAYAASMIPRLFRGSIMAGLGALLFWGLVLFGAVAAYAYRFELREVKDRVMATLIPGTPIETGTREVTVIGRADGQFIVNGTIAGRTATFVLDTGASTVVLRAEDAARMKIPVRRLVYDVEVSTANGRASAAEIEIPALSIGPITQTRVRALVAKPGALNQNLLGMSFLNGLASFTFSNDRLVMRGASRSDHGAPL